MNSPLTVEELFGLFHLIPRMTLAVDSMIKHVYTEM